MPKQRHVTEERLAERGIARLYPQLSFELATRAKLSALLLKRPLSEIFESALEAEIARIEQTLGRKIESTAQMPRLPPGKTFGYRTEAAMT